MYNGRHISFKRVLFRAMRHPNAADLSVEQAAEYAFELIRNLGIPLSFGDNVKFLNVKDSRAELPKDIIYLKGMRFQNPFALGDTVEDDVEFFEQYVLTLKDINWLPVRYTGNIYHSSFYCKGYTEPSCESDITYTINNNYAFLSEPTGAIEIAYKALITDEDGYPMIPDNQAFEDALYYYILKEYFFPLVGIGKISQYFFEKIEQEYAWATGKAQNSLMLAGMDNWESVMNGVRRLIQYQNQSDTGFSELHKREKIRKFR